MGRITQRTATAAVITTSAEELGHAPCRYAGATSAECVIGTFVRGAEPWVRRGAFVEVADHVLWLDVCGPAERVEEVDAWSSELATGAVVGGVS